jgi:hypothetical protein
MNTPTAKLPRARRKRFLSVTISVPNQQRWLESDKALALRTPLAGLLKFVRAFCERDEELPPTAANAKVFRARARPQPSQGNRRLSDLPSMTPGHCVSATSQRRSNKRACLWTVEVEPVLETPLNWPRNVAAHSSRLQKVVATVNRPASGARSASALTDSSRRLPIGPENVTDRNSSP